MADKQIVHFISGHLDLTQAEFNLHYRFLIDRAIEQNQSFVVGDARGADLLAQQYLFAKTDAVVVYHHTCQLNVKPSSRKELKFLAHSKSHLKMTRYRLKS